MTNPKQARQQKKRCESNKQASQQLEAHDIITVYMLAITKQDSMHTTHTSRTTATDGKGSSLQMCNK
jgi:hypothetical protein